MLRGNKFILIALVAALATVGLAHAEEMKVEPGYNFLATSPGSYTTITLPAGFFGEKNGIPSDAIVDRRIDLEGRPFGSLGLEPQSNLVVKAGDCHSKGGHHHCHEATPEHERIDTITKVGGTSVSSVGGTGTTTLQMVALSLQTPQGSPLTVTYGDQKPSTFRVVLTHDSSVDQEVGSVTLKRKQDNGGIMEVELPVAFKALFTSRGQRFGPVALNTTLLSDDNGFTVTGISGK